MVVSCGATAAENHNTCYVIYVRTILLFQHLPIAKNSSEFESNSGFNRRRSNLNHLAVHCTFFMIFFMENSLWYLRRQKSIFQWPTRYSLREEVHMIFRDFPRNFSSKKDLKGEVIHDKNLSPSKSDGQGHEWLHPATKVLFRSVRILLRKKVDKLQH